MRVLISGSTGMIGRALIPRLEADGHTVERLLRPSSSGVVGAGIVWDPAAGTLDASGLEGFDAVVHLAGENIANRRWSEKQKRIIRDSRVVGTELLVSRLTSLQNPPSALLCASAGGYYGSDRGDEWLDDSASPGADFLAVATRDWEEACAPASEVGIRVVNMRIGVALSADGGMLSRILPIFRRGLGGKLGAGAQYMSWISGADLTNAFVWAMEREELSGGVNISSPNPVSNAEFTRALGRALRRPTPFFVPRFALRLAQGELADVVLSSLRMAPERLTASGFEFQHPRIEDALAWALGD